MVHELCDQRLTIIEVPVTFEITIKSDFFTSVKIVIKGHARDKGSH